MKLQQSSYKDTLPSHDLERAGEKEEGLGMIWEEGAEGEKSSNGQTVELAFPWVIMHIFRALYSFQGYMYYLLDFPQHP